MGVQVAQTGPIEDEELGFWIGNTCSGQNLGHGDELIELFLLNFICQTNLLKHEWKLKTGSSSSEDHSHI